MTSLDEDPQPTGELMFRTYALPKDGNGENRVYAGWIISQMDLAASAAAERLTHCRVVTVAVGEMNFVSPVKMGSKLGIYTTIEEVGRTSIKIGVDVWAHKYNESQRHKVTEAKFVMVAVDDNGHTQVIDQH